MSETRVPEWFIGGPWHGRDKLTHPSVRNVPGFVISYDPAEPESQDRLYEAKRFAIGETVLTIWVYEDLDELTAATRLAEVLLAPHKVPAGVSA